MSSQTSVLLVATARRYADMVQALAKAAAGIEKETGVASERSKVSAVFINRLRQKMKLESDPTTIYGLTLGKTPFNRELTRADLQSNTPYNTYVIAGLPPGPIANPGRASLEAAANPARNRRLIPVRPRRSVADPRSAGGSPGAER